MKYQPHKFNYRWTLKDAAFTKDKGKVFSCFACGGGSSMGYKLSGYDVIGCNEIDPRMIYTYCQNHNPRFNFLEPIQTFKLRDDLPDVSIHTPTRGVTANSPIMLCKAKFQSTLPRGE